MSASAPIERFLLVHYATTGMILVTVCQQK
jgi:hypothetical protein